MKAINSPVGVNAVDFKRLVDKELERIMSDAQAKAGVIDAVYDGLLEAMRGPLLGGGKRLRPYLAYLAYSGLGGDDPVAFTPAAASQELLHYFLLIHDDIIDRDLTRHGVLNVEGAYHQYFISRGIPEADALHYAESFALLAGNAACALALQAITMSKFEPGLKLEALGCIQNMLFEIMGGELTDVDVSIPGAPPPTIGRLLNICHYKTATYSFQTPLQLGAILAGAGTGVQMQLREFGHSLGIAFQLSDDLLGVYGEEAKLGKPVTSDMREGKQTLLINYAFELMTPAQSRAMQRLWGNRKAGLAGLTKVRSIIRECGAQDKTIKLANRYLQDSLATLAKIPLTAASRDEISRLAHFCVERQY